MELYVSHEPLLASKVEFRALTIELSFRNPLPQCQLISLVNVKSTHRYHTATEIECHQP